MKRAIQWVVPLAVLASASLGIFLPAPNKLPALALGSNELLWAERSLVLLYAFLLLAVPLLKGLQGELPIELSARGARWQETSAESGRATAILNERVETLSGEREKVGSVLLSLTERLGRVEERVASPLPGLFHRRTGR